MSLQDYGWSEFFAASFEEQRKGDEQPARVTWSASGFYRLQAANGSFRAITVGRLRHAASSAADLPAVGDWVAAVIDGSPDARIERVLARRSTLSRKVAGSRSDEQIVASNVDLVIVVMGLDGDYNVRRLERFLTTVRECGAQPLVLLNKTDLCPDVEARRQEVEQMAAGVPVLSSSCKQGSGVAAVFDRMAPRTTAVLVGSSGVGKSTLINRLLGEEVQRTIEVRDGDSRGRHATTHRELFRLSSGALLIDSPGIRELQLWGEEKSLARAFDDIAELAASCRYRDCRHEAEQGCAVLQAVETGALTASRVAGYHELQKELRHLELRRNASAQRVQKHKWRAIHREMRRSGKNRRN